MDCIATVFEMRNHYGYSVPKLYVIYSEKGTDKHWHISLGGTRAYLVRIGKGVEVGDDKDNRETEAEDSQFIISRAKCALLLSGAGIFYPVVRGRIFFQTIEVKSWVCGLDISPYSKHEQADISKSFSEEIFEGWISAISAYTPLRRAAEDLFLALSNPLEAFVFLYRGFEWLKDGLSLSYADIAKDIGVKESELKEIGRIANADTGVRHATRDGSKMRASTPTYATWASGLVDAINAARKRLEPSFERMAPQDVVDLLKVAVPLRPYE